jgi:hypothetical protein
MSTQQQPVGMSDELNAGGCVEDQIVERQKRGPKEARQSKEKRSAKSFFSQRGSISELSYIRTSTK